MRNQTTSSRLSVIAAFVAGAIVVLPAPAQLAAERAALAQSSTVRSTDTRYQPSRFPKRALMYYSGVWGIDSLSVKQVESGEMVRFSYRVLDASKAKVLNDKKQEPSLVDEQAHVKLVVPQMEKVGQLRQSSTPEAGKVYWMLFSNKGRFVKRGDRVSIVIGPFRADGLIVD